jgi:hypothetical protein
VPWNGLPHRASYTLSSIGAEKTSGLGLITALHLVEMLDGFNSGCIDFGVPGTERFTGRTASEGCAQGAGGGPNQTTSEPGSSARH